MFRFCCGRILLASAYYKKLGSRARLFKKLALGIPSGALDSRQNVRFPPVECSVVSARSNSNGPIRVESELPPARHKPLRKAEEVNFKSKFSFFTSLSAAEAHVFGVKFIGLYGTVVFIAIRDFSF